jgi:hypothetical protein
LRLDGVEDFLYGGAMFVTVGFHDSQVLPAKVFVVVVSSPHVKAVVFPSCDRVFERHEGNPLGDAVNTKNGLWFVLQDDARLVG